MAFNHHHINNYEDIHKFHSASDSDDFLRDRRPRNLGEVFYFDSKKNELAYAMPRSGSQGSLGSLSSHNQHSPLHSGSHSNNPRHLFASSHINSHEDSDIITYNKSPEEQEFDPAFHQEPVYYYYNEEPGDVGSYQMPYYAQSFEPNFEEQEEEEGDVSDDRQEWHGAAREDDDCHMDEERQLEMETETRASEYCSTVANDQDDRTTFLSDFDERWGRSLSYQRDFPEDGQLRMKEEIASHGMMMEFNNAGDHNKLLFAIRRNFMRLREAIERLLQGKQLRESDLQGLSNFEKEIIFCISEKKSKNAGMKSSKRREEKQKLFFKSAIKFIENRFYSQNCHTLRKKEIDPKLFYLAYFDDVASKMGVEVSIFFPPCQKRKYRMEGAVHAKNELKSFSLKYIELILSSERFMRETIEYLEYGFVQNYAKTRYQKIDKTLEHLMNVLDHAWKEHTSYTSTDAELFSDFAQRRIREVLLNNSKSKLPWSDAELDEAKEFARKTIEKVYNNNKGR